MTKNAPKTVDLTKVLPPKDAARVLAQETHEAMRARSQHVHEHERVLEPTVDGVRLKVVPRRPLRQESPEDEISRYPGRMKAWNEADALSRSVSAAERRKHLTSCSDVPCPHAAHVLPRRELKTESDKDRRHLSFCMEESNCPAHHPSHRLPPHPLKTEDEWCCTGQHFPKSDPCALFECPLVPAALAARRRAEAQALGYVRGFIEPVVIKTSWLPKDSTLDLRPKDA